jgi:hypothetical protein
VISSPGIETVPFEPIDGIRASQLAIFGHTVTTILAPNPGMADCASNTAISSSVFFIGDCARAYLPCSSLSIHKLALVDMGKHELGGYARFRHLRDSVGQQSKNLRPTIKFMYAFWKPPVSSYAL